MKFSEFTRWNFIGYELNRVGIGTKEYQIKNPRSHHGDVLNFPPSNGHPISVS